MVYGGATGATIDLTNLTATQGFIIQGDAAGDRAGRSVSSAGDVNGDGFDDLIVGAPYGDNGGSDAGEAYVVYGGATETESTTSVGKVGTDVADNFTGNAGNDTFTSIGTDDVVRGGAGNDAITITSLDFAEVDGGRGADTLILGGSGQTLDLTGARTDIEGFEQIDLAGSGNNRLILDKLSLLDLSDNTAGGVTTLTVRGGAGDALTLKDASAWTANGIKTVGAVTFNAYVNGQAEVLVDQAVTIEQSAPPLVLDLNGDGVAFSDLNQSSAYYDIDGDGVREKASWLSSSDAFIGYDANGDGLISGRNELVLSDYVDGAQTDLEGLVAFDTDGSGVFDDKDAEWSAFKIWQDLNSDGDASLDEIMSLDELNIASIELQSTNQTEVFAEGDAVSSGRFAVNLTNGDALVGYDMSLGFNDTDILKSDVIL